MSYISVSKILGGIYISFIISISSISMAQVYNGSNLANVSQPMMANFDSYSIGDYNTTNTQADFGSSLGNARGINDLSFGIFPCRGDNTSIVDDGGNKKLRIRYRAGCYSDSTNQGGAAWKMTMSGYTHHLKLSFKVKFESGFDRNYATGRYVGGKMHGISTQAYPGNCGNNGVSKGFSSRFMRRPTADGSGVRLVVYTYYPNMPGGITPGNCGLDVPLLVGGPHTTASGAGIVFPSTYILANGPDQDPYNSIDGHDVMRLQAGREYSISLEMKLNTTGNADGYIRAWIDGQTGVDFHGIDVGDLADMDNLLKQGLFETFFGGGSSPWAPLTTSYASYDDFRLEALPIDPVFNTITGKVLSGTTNLTGRIINLNPGGLNITTTFTGYIFSGLNNNTYAATVSSKSGYNIVNGTRTTLVSGGISTGRDFSVVICGGSGQTACDAVNNCNVATCNNSGTLSCDKGYTVSGSICTPCGATGQLACSSNSCIGGTCPSGPTGCTTGLTSIGGICTTPIDAVCGTTLNQCVTGTSNNAGTGACGTTATWTCSGLYGGLPATCSFTNPSCPVVTNTITGKVLSGTINLTGRIINLNPGGLNITTTSTGYIFSGLNNDTYAATVSSKSGYNIVNGTRTALVSGGISTGRDFSVVICGGSGQTACDAVNNCNVATCNNSGTLSCDKGYTVSGSICTPCGATGQLACSSNSCIGGTCPSGSTGCVAPLVVSGGLCSAPAVFNTITGKVLSGTTNLVGWTVALSGNSSKITYTTGYIYTGLTDGIYDIYVLPRSGYNILTPTKTANLNGGISTGINFVVAPCGATGQVSCNLPNNCSVGPCNTSGATSCNIGLISSGGICVLMLIPVNGVCNNSVINICSAGTSNNSGSNICGTTTSRTCAGSNGGSSEICSFTNPTCPIDGVCGSAHKIYGYGSSGRGSDIFCSSGNISTTPSFPSAGSSVLRDCLGSHGGQTVTCQASQNLPDPIDGICGPANDHIFSPTDIGYNSMSQCGSGDGISTDTRFPSYGETVSWTCGGANSGVASTTCSASRQVPTPSITNIHDGDTIYNSGIYVYGSGIPGAIYYLSVDDIIYTGIVSSAGFRSAYIAYILDGTHDIFVYQTINNIDSDVYTVVFENISHIDAPTSSIYSGQIYHSGSIYISGDILSGAVYHIQIDSDAIYTGLSSNNYYDRWIYGLTSGDHIISIWQDYMGLVSEIVYTTIYVVPAYSGSSLSGNTTGSTGNITTGSTGIIHNPEYMAVGGGYSPTNSVSLVPLSSAVDVTQTDAQTGIIQISISTGAVHQSSNIPNNKKMTISSLIDQIWSYIGDMQYILIGSRPDITSQNNTHIYDEIYLLDILEKAVFR